MCYLIHFQWFIKVPTSKFKEKPSVFHYPIKSTYAYITEMKSTAKVLFCFEYNWQATPRFMKNGQF